MKGNKNMVRYEAPNQSADDTDRAVKQTDFKMIGDTDARLVAYERKSVACSFKKLKGNTRAMKVRLR